MNDLPNLRKKFEAEFPSRNHWLGDQYDTEIDQARWEAFKAGARVALIEQRRLLTKHLRRVDDLAQ